MLDAETSWVTSAGEADSYVWTSRPVAADGPSTLWLVPATTAGLAVGAPFDGLGLRGNASSPVTASGARVPASAMLGADGAGLRAQGEAAHRAASVDGRCMARFSPTQKRPDGRPPGDRVLAFI